MRSQTAPVGREVLLKVQSVRIIPLTIAATAGMTLGQQIDKYLDTAAIDGVVPNKLVLDLNPPRERDAYDVSED